MITNIYVPSYLPKNNWYYIKSQNNTGQVINQKNATRKHIQRTWKKHHKWMSRSNRGVLHVGLHPTLLPLSVIQLDVFHMECLMGKRLMIWIRIVSKGKGHSFELILSFLIYCKLFGPMESCVCGGQASHSLNCLASKSKLLH